VSRACYEAAAPILHQKLPIQISSRQKIKDDVKNLVADSIRSQFLSHVRCLKLWGRMPLADEKSIADGGDSSSFDPVELAEGMGNSEEYDAEFGGVFVRDLPDGPAEDVAEAWTPLASLIQKCTHLTDLVWVCWNQLPPCVLAAIHEHHPACRLHMRSFRLRSLAGAVTDTHELDLIRSPCLYSISVKTVIKDSDGKFDYNGSAILQVAALAPNLRHINIIAPRTASSPALRRTRGAHQEPWKGFVPPLEIRKRGSLTSLSYFGRRGMSVKDIEEWPNSVDMSKMRYLILGDVSDPLVFQHLTQNINFAPLELLDFGLSPTTMGSIDSLVSEAESLLENLDLLTAFRLSGHLAPSIFDKILQQHGPTIRRLTLNPHASNSGNIKSPISAISSDEIRKVAAHCPALEYLSICIPNTGFLGQIEYAFSDVCPNLHHLRELELNVDLDLSDLLMEKAARKIWGLINKEMGGCPLNCLQILGSNVSLYFYTFPNKPALCSAFFLLFIKIICNKTQKSSIYTN
jgi:hypothetical protein